MSPVRVTWGRTLGLAHNLYTTAFAVGSFLAAAGASFAFALADAEGSALPLGAVWASAVAPVLPFLAALLGMDVWSAEIRTGRIESLLSLPVRERELAFGKFLGVWTAVILSTLFALGASVLALAQFAPAALRASSAGPFAAGFVALVLQGALWSAVAAAASASFRNGAAAACATAALLVALPRGLWAALRRWSAQGGTSYGAMPLDAHVLDMACGVFSTAVIATYAVLTVLALFVAAKTVAASRLAGNGHGGKRFSTLFAVGLGFTVAALAAALAWRTDAVVELPRAAAPLSARTRGILSEARGEVHVTCFLPRSDARWRRAAHFLRSLVRAADAQGGLRLVPHWVDAAWDLGAAERLVGRGVRESAFVFEYGRRLAAVPFDAGWGERACASAILRLVAPPSRRTVCWTRGHGEAAFDAYGPWGCSDIARELAREGYGNRALSLADGAGIPGDCALVVVAGAKEDFSRAELARLDAYLKQGGRVLALLSSPTAGGIASLLPAWGIRPVAAKLAGTRSVSGTDALADDFAEHPISGPLEGSQVVFERPVAFEPSAAAGTGADGIAFTALAKAGGAALAAIAERGAGEDLALRPTRLVAVGDAAFAANAALAARANANRDFFLNCVAYLSGTDATTAGGESEASLATGLDRAARRNLLLASGVAVPLAVFLLMALRIALQRRRR